MTLSLFTALLTGAAAATPSPDADWRVVALYDPSALAARTEGGQPRPGGYVWQASPAMTASCGPAKAPDGLGVFEAEAMATGLSPSLAILLRHVGDGVADPLRTSQVQISVGLDGRRLPLRPAVAPRALQIEVTGDAPLRDRRQVRTQIQTEICLEHKVGRGWIGGVTGDQALREAFVLDPPPQGGADRRFYVGQRDPVPALLGPPVACMAALEDDDTASAPESTAPGATSLDVVPADVWGATLGSCPTESSQALPLALGLQVLLPGPERVATPPRRWRRLTVNVDGGEDQRSTRVSATLGDPSDAREDLIAASDDVALYTFAPGSDHPTGLTDVVATIPYEYPAVGPASDPYRYTVMIVPAWQLNETIRRLYRDSTTPLDEPMIGPGHDLRDAVGWVLEHPERLQVQIEPTAGLAQEWPDLLRTSSPLPTLLRDWGFPAGLLSGREPVALLGDTPPRWDEVAAAQRATHHALLLASLGCVMVIAIAGLRRAHDLWTPHPEERVDYWPGQPQAETVAAPPKPPSAPSEPKAEQAA